MMLLESWQLCLKKVSSYTGRQTMIGLPSPAKTMHVRKKMKTSTGSPFNSTSLLKSSIFSVPSNGVTNRLKKLGAKSEKIHFRSRQLI